MNGNPFYVHPGNDYSQGLSGLSQVLQQSREARKQKILAEQAKQVLATGDPVAISNFSLEHPEFSQSLMQSMGIRNQAQSTEKLNTFTQILANPQQAPEVLTESIQRIEARGGDASNSRRALQQFQQDPEGALRSVEVAFSGTFPDQYRAMQDAQKKYTGATQALHERAVASGLDEGSEDYQAFMAYGGNPPQVEREMREDAQGVLRYIDDGTAVFPEVEQTVLALSDKDRWTKAKDIRAEITKATGDFVKVADAWDRISASAENPSAAGDLALIFNYMKMLDPGSTVREGEFATAQNAGGLSDRIRAMYNNVRNGERLTADQRKDFLSRAKSLYSTAEERASNIIDGYVSVAERGGLTRDDVVISRGGSPDVDTERNFPKVTTQEEFNALPAGSLYLEQDDSGAWMEMKKE